MSKSCSPARARGMLAGALVSLSLACATGPRARGGEKPSSALRVVVPADDRDAEVWVDGQYLGVVVELEDPRTGLPLLAPGVHRVEVRKPGRFPVQRTVEVPRDAPPETTVEAELLADPR